MRDAASTGGQALISPASDTKISGVDNAVLVIAEFIPAATHNVAMDGGMEGNKNVIDRPKAAPAQNKGNMSIQTISRDSWSVLNSLWSQNRSRQSI